MFAGKANFRGFYHVDESFRPLVQECETLLLPRPGGPPVQSSEEIVQEILDLWADTMGDIRTTLLQEMVANVARWRDSYIDAIDIKILHPALKELQSAFQVCGEFRNV